MNTERVTMSKCTCGHPSCRDWWLSVGSFCQGSGFDEATAKRIVDLLNGSGAEPVAYCDPSDPINSTAFAWPGTDREQRHKHPLYDALPPATADAPANVAYEISCARDAVLRAIDTNFPHRRDSIDACVNTIFDGLDAAAAHPQTQPSAATAVNTAEGVDEDMANIGRAFMAKLPKDYSWCECPTEYVTELRNQLHDASSPPASASMSAGVTVPRVPTQAMLDAGYLAISQGRGAKSAWEEMIRAAERARANTRAGVDADSIENNEDWLDRVAQSIRDCLDGETVIDAENVAFAIQYANTCMNMHTVCLELSDAKGAE